MNKLAYPVIDLFAGPGGLGEGFASVLNSDNRRKFNNAVSIDSDKHSHQTLLLRHFIRGFNHSEVPSEYYDYLAGKIQFKCLFNCYQSKFEEAEKVALRIQLGNENRPRIKQIINSRIAANNKWVLVGGPPCQAYSIVGRSRMKGKKDFEKDERHYLYREYLSTIIDHKPPVFVMENVKGLISAKINGKPIINTILSDLRNPSLNSKGKLTGLNYRLFSLSESEITEMEVDPRSFLVKAEKYGVPQARHRIFIVGIRSDLNFIPPQSLQNQNSPSVVQTIGDLPPIRSGVSSGTDSVKEWKKQIAKLTGMDLFSESYENQFSVDIANRIKQIVRESKFPIERIDKEYPTRPVVCFDSLSGIYDPKLSGLDGHESRAHMPSDLRRYMYATVFAEKTGRSPKIADFPRFLLPEHKNVKHSPIEAIFSDRFRVQLPDRVSTTITSHISKDGHYYIHYDPFQCRSLTIREAARLQTFPDNYKFEGPRTSQYHQIGNAVPPYIAKQIAEIIAEVLDSIKEKC